MQRATHVALLAWVLLLVPRCSAPVAGTRCADQADCPSSYACRDGLCVRTQVAEAGADGAVLDGRAPDSLAADARTDRGPAEQPPADGVADDRVPVDTLPLDGASAEDSASADHGDSAILDQGSGGERPACTRDEDCDDGQPCTGTETCLVTGCASSGNPCGGATPGCLVTSGGGYQCVACTSDAHCGGGTPFCAALACVQCRDPGDCGDGNACTADRCTDGVCDHPLLDRGQACSTGYCDGDGACVECTERGHCLDPARPACVADACVACETHADCADAFECTTDRCLVGSVCSNDAQVRGTPCSDGVCNGATTCVPCTQDAHCAGVPGTPYCRGDACVRCVTASDCNDGKPCTVDSCTPSYTCSNTSVPEGQRITGCAWYCDGEGNCDYCTRDSHCTAYGYSDCHTCQGGSCLVQGGKTCLAYDCADYLFGLYDTGSQLLCLAYDSQQVSGSCNTWGTCIALDPSGACSVLFPWWGTAAASCDSSCGKPEAERFGCDPDSLASTAYLGGFCVTSGQTASCNGRSCTNYSSVAYQYVTSCTWYGGCQSSVEDYCGNHLCIQVDDNTAACDASCSDVSECVSGPGGNVVMSCEGGLCCERGTYTECN